MSIAKFSIQQPVLVNLFMVLVIMAGLFAFNSISKEEFPEISLNAVSITTTYRGVAPEEIEPFSGEALSLTAFAEAAGGAASDVELDRLEGRGTILFHFPLPP